MTSPLARQCQRVLLRHTLTSHGGAWGSRGSPRRWTSSRTRCTCCRLGRAGESDPGHTRIRARSSTNRTIRSASRRPDARESGLNRTRIRARSSSNRNVCILSPCQFSFRQVLYQTNSHRAMPHRALLLSHRRKPSGLDESHGITSRAAVSALPYQRGLQLPRLLPFCDMAMTTPPLLLVE